MSKLETTDLGLSAQVHAEVSRIVSGIMGRHPDARHNAGKSILEAFVWDEIASLSKGKSDQVWERMERTGIYDKPQRAGRFECGESPHFIIKATVSEPVKRFNEEELAKVLEESKFKIPPHMTKGFVAAAKKAGNPMVRLTIVER